MLVFAVLVRVLAGREGHGGKHAERRDQGDQPDRDRASRARERAPCGHGCDQPDSLDPFRGERQGVDRLGLRREEREPGRHRQRVCADQPRKGHDRSVQEKRVRVPGERSCEDGQGDGRRRKAHPGGDAFLEVRRGERCVDAGAHRAAQDDKVSSCLAHRTMTSPFMSWE